MQTEQVNNAVSKAMSDFASTIAIYNTNFGGSTLALALSGVTV
jgi:hypothetical protein